MSPTANVMETTLQTTYHFNERSIEPELLKDEDHQPLSLQLDITQAKEAIKIYDDQDLNEEP